MPPHPTEAPRTKDQGPSTALLGDPRLSPFCQHRLMSDITLSVFSDQLADAAESGGASLVQVAGRRQPASGVVFAPDLVLTTTRALGREDGLRVRAADGRLLDAELAGWDPASTLVLLRVPGLGVTPATPAPTSPRVGHFALALGRSWSNALTASAGIVSVIGGPLPTGRGQSIDRVIRTTAPMHGGFAGGALVNVSGQVIGICTAGQIRGLGVVIPADIAWPIGTRLAEQGTPKRGHLGLAGQPVALPDRFKGDDERTHALLVVGITAGGPADRAGLLVGDLVTKFGDSPVQSPVDLLRLLESDSIGRMVTVEIVRGGVAQQLEVTVGVRPEA